jgi:hypothetical protein
MNPDLAPVPASGRRRAAATSNADRRRWSIPQLAAVAVAVIGGLLVLAGGLRASVFAPSAITEASLASPDQPVITSAVGLLGLNGPRVEVSAVEGGRRPVFVGIGRAADVDSYLAQVSPARTATASCSPRGSATSRRCRTRPARMSGWSACVAPARPT